MDANSFKAYKRRFVAATRAVLSEGTPEELAEAAFPAYQNPNPLISFLFWHRIRVVMSLIEKEKGLDSVLDFGCGGGVMLPFLSGMAGRVVAYDVDYRPLRRIRTHIPLGRNVELPDSRKLPIDLLRKGTFDLVIALDVLEHVPDVTEITGQLMHSLRPGGQLVVSGPTENLFYRAGRLFAGKAYTGHYHQSNIYDVHRAMAAHGPVDTVARLFFPCPLFMIYRSRVQ